MRTIHAAARYLPCDDLWVITTYYNPARYRTRRQNYQQFAKRIIEAGMKLITVECAFGQERFEFDPSPEIIQVRGRHVMWLKERLINVAISKLPPQAEKIAWIDADILFSNPAWAVEVAASLDRYPLAQPCDSLHRLERAQTTYAGTGYFRRSFACQLQRRPESALIRGVAHGFPGGAWAARRSLIERHGLYDAEILGGNDELFAHALGGGFGSPCVRGITGAERTERPRLVDRIVDRLARIPWPHWLANRYVARSVAVRPTPSAGEALFGHYLRWAEGLYQDVRGQVGCVPGMALHLWHGDPVNRRYVARTAMLERHHFDPSRDLRVNAHGVWEWSSDKAELHQAVARYFLSRREDG